MEPPDGRNHPLWTRATDCARDGNGQKIPSQPLYTRRTTSTALQLACDHAFTRSYSKRFRRANPPEYHSCPCGFGLRNPKHLILHCPRHTRHHINAGIAGRYNPLTLTQLFSTKRGVVYLLDFIKMSSIATQPECVLRHGRDILPMWVKLFTKTLGSGFGVLSTRAKSEEDFDSY